MPNNLPKELRADAYIAHLLYDAESGYYSQKVSTIGKNGDFSTSATLSPLLSKGIAHWINSQNLDFPILEIGAGNAALAEQLIKKFPNYFIVETSPKLQKLQKEKLQEQATWFSSPEEALQALNGNAIIIHNELVDAFPPRIFQRTLEGWSERWILTESPTTDYFKPIDAKALPSSSIWSKNWPIGQIVEIQESYFIWLKKWAHLWKNGVMLSIDYGEELQDLYYRQPEGSLRGYSQHQMITGNQLFNPNTAKDITCDVNFSDLELFGEQFGWEKMDYQMQMDFLLPFVTDSQIDHQLIHPMGAGAAFKFLSQRKTSY